MQILNQKSLDDKIRDAREVVSERILREITEFLRTAPDAKLYNIDPWRFASQRKLNRMATLKAFLHLTLNERLDYFGTTVNIAARVQGLSDGRNIMASGPIVAEGGAADYLCEKKWHSDSFVTSLKGLKASYQVHKMFRAGA